MLKKYLLLFGIGLIWGSQFIFQKAALTSFSPEIVGAGRAIVGFITLSIICLIMNLKPRSKTSWWLYMLIGFLEATVPFVLVPWGQQYLSSAITSILIGTIPFFVVLFTPFLNANDKVTKSNVISLIVGFIGIVVLFAPDLLKGGSAFDYRGPLAILAAAASFGLALLLLSRCSGEQPIIVARNVLGSASFQLLLVSLLTQSVVPGVITTKSIVSILYLGIMCAGVVYLLYMMLIVAAGPVFTSLTNYLVPTFGVFIGVLFAHDSISIYTWSALVIILLAVAINQRPSRDNKLVADSGAH
ncbi:DMT family transporter [Vibrio sp. S4M6]|nr:DMT family transporter [Vibrio sinus]MCL9780706.1 DMT family transporter [Vibrio sinus]